MRKFRWLWLMLLCAPVAFGQGIYKWVDSQGQVHYGEAPPEGTHAAPVELKSEPVAPPAVSDEERNEKTQRLLRTFEEERSQRQEQEAKAAEDAEKRKRNCNVARDRLRNYQQAGRIYDLDKNGERRIYNDAERAETLKRAEADVTKYCK